MKGPLRVVRADAAWPRPAEAWLTKWAEINTAAISANTAELSSHVTGGAALMAMVKANGYGHGAGLAASAAVAGGASWIGVSSADEALQLRSLGIRAPMLVVGWVPDAALPALVAADVDITVFDAETVAAAAAAARAHPARLHLKLDSGMGRIGARPDGLENLDSALLHAAPRIEVAGIFTQLADADGDDLEFTLSQHERFIEMSDRFRQRAPRALLHCANSAALLRLPETHHDMVRPGIAMYGYAPVACAGAVSLQPALALRARITQVKVVQPGDSVGYGHAWTAASPTRVATLSIGYADGIHRAQAGRGQVLVGGMRCPIIGRVSMDQIGVDISAVDAAKAGDIATLVGPADGAMLGADEVAQAASTVSYEVLTSISPRVARVVCTA